MFDYVPDVFRKQYAETEEEADRWYTDPDNNRRPPELLPRDEVARAINTEVKAGRGTPAGGVFLDIASRLPAEDILKRLPSMYHQFKELADVDITKEPMEVGPTCHYVMGGVEVDPDTGAASGTVPGLFAAGEVSGGMHGSNRLGGNSLSDLLVFGKRAGEYAAAYVDGLGQPGRRWPRPTSRRRWRPRSPRCNRDERREPVHAAARPAGGDGRPGRHHPARGRAGGALKRLAELQRAGGQGRARPAAARYNPGWHLALDLRNMLVVSECTAKAALEREESRGGHTREDFPAMDAEVAEGQPGLLAGRRRGAARRASRCRRCGRSCSACSTVPSWRST